MFVMALAGTRDENPNVNHAAVHQDVQALHNAGTGKLGTVSHKASWDAPVLMRPCRTRSRSAESC